MEPQFAIENAICKMGKISNNLEKHGEEEVIVFAIPIAGAMLQSRMHADDPANAIAADPLFTRSVFNDNKGFLEPMAWARSPIGFPEKYEEAQVSIKLPSDEVLTFDGARIGGIEMTPTPGGLAQVDFQVQVRPELDRENLLLQEYQHCEVTITVLDAKVALKKKGRQQQLPLQQPEASQELARSSDEELEQARQNDETQRQLGEALRGLEAQQQAGQQPANSEPGEHVDGEELEPVAAGGDDPEAN